MINHRTRCDFPLSIFSVKKKDFFLTCVPSRDHPYMLEGYGSIALEILREIPYVDAIIVPVGTGGLAAAIASVVKHDKPDCLVYVSNSFTQPPSFIIYLIGFISGYVSMFPLIWLSTHVKIEL